ncbi:hypothetical protein [Alicyclobacillus fastidiosus]|uniref:hypothetical protein n=1 Tax=Alicyclobacillus fastidiosus TaxID=392011 RepID=UPI0024E1272B|nr:hypothetical protein [Alicyclobacillus fastidiosus]
MRWFRMWLGFSSFPDGWWIYVDMPMTKDRTSVPLTAPVFVTGPTVLEGHEPP